MTTLFEARKIINERLAGYKPKTPTRTGVLGDGRGLAASNLFVPGRDNYVYARDDVQSTRFFQVLNRSAVSPAHNLPVIIGYNEEEVFSEEQVLNINYSGLGEIEPDTVPVMGNHHWQHEFQGGDDVTLDSRQLLPGLVYPTDPPSMQVRIGPFVYFWNTWRSFEETLSPLLSEYRPSLSNYVTYVLITLDPETGSIKYNPGIPVFNMASSDFETVVPAPAGNDLPLGYVRLTSGTTSLNYTAGDNNIGDGRLFVNPPQLHLLERVRQVEGYLGNDPNLATTGAAANITDGAGFLRGSISETQVPFASEAGVLVGDADMTFDTDTLTVTKLLAPTSVSTPLIITASGALNVTPASGSGVNVNLATTGDFAVNTSQLWIDTSASVIGMGTATGFTSPNNYRLHILHSGSRSILLGSVTTDLAQKTASIGVAHYDGTVAPLTLIAGTSAVATSVLNIGGSSTGAGTAATTINFFIAETNSTLTGTNIAKIVNGKFAIGQSAYTGPAPGVLGAWLNMGASTFTDNDSAAGTVAAATFAAFRQATYATTGNAITVTNAASVYVQNAPAAGANVTITNNWAVWIDAGNERHDGNVVIGSSAFPSGAPVGNLDVGATTGGVLTLVRNDTTVTANDVIGRIDFWSNDAAVSTNFYPARIEVQATNTISTDINPGRMIFSTTPTGVAAALTEALRIENDQSVTCTSPTGGLGYRTGAGGAVTQITSRTTGVTTNTVCGAITLVSAAGTASWQTFTVTDSAVAATDVVIINQKSGTDDYMIHVTRVAAGAFDITFATTGGTTTETPVFNFAVVKAVAA